MNIHFGHKSLPAIAALAVASFTFGAAPLSADDSAATSDWEYSAAIYLWAPKIVSTTPRGDSELPFYRILDDLELTFMGIAGARKDQWSMSMDLIYLDLKSDVNRELEFQGPGGEEVDVSGDVRMKNWIVTPTVGYAIHDSGKARFEIVGGVRYLWLKAAAELYLNGTERVDRSESNSYWDAIIGARAKIGLSERWYLPLYFDIGTGNSDGTWQGFAGIGYQFNTFNTVLAYRYLDYNFDQDNQVMEGLSVKGMFLGFQFNF
jgi:hypothetical protein